MTVDVDVIIAGGGPVGLATAIEARLAGFSVTVVEPRAGTIDKACGEGLMPGAVEAFKRLGVEPAGREFAGIRYLSGDREVSHRFRGGPGLGARRLELHAALSARAAELGVERVEGRVDRVEQTADTIIAVGLTGRWLIACDGLHSTVAREVGLARQARAGSRKRFGIRRHFAVEPWSEFVDVHWTPTAEVYVTPVGDRTVGVAVLGPQRTDYEEVLASVPGIASRIDGVEPASTQRGAGPLHQVTTARTAGRVLLVGDASGYVDAITGEGLRVGLAQAQVAIAALVAADPAAYERSWRRVTRDFRVLTTGLVAWATSPLRPALVPAAVALPQVFGGVVERLAR